MAQTSVEVHLSRVVEGLAQWSPATAYYGNVPNPADNVWEI